MLRRPGGGVSETWPIPERGKDLSVERRAHRARGGRVRLGIAGTWQKWQYLLCFAGSPSSPSASAAAVGVASAAAVRVASAGCSFSARAVTGEESPSGEAEDSCEVAAVPKLSGLLSGPCCPGDAPVGPAPSGSAATGPLSVSSAAEPPSGASTSGIRAELVTMQTTDTSARRRNCATARFRCPVRNPPRHPTKTANRSVRVSRILLHMCVVYIVAYKPLVREIVLVGRKSSYLRVT